MILDLAKVRRVRKAIAASLPAQLSRRAAAKQDAAQADAALLTDPIFTPMPRRAQVRAPLRDDLGLIPTQELTPVHTGLVKTFRRLLVWIGALIWYLTGTTWASIRRRNSEDYQAVRLRQTFERAGGTLIKIGQQLSIRLDLLPLRVCEELSLMLDQVPAFPTSEAIAAIERATGRHLEDLFSSFDPEPIGAASIACVYQAVLRETGEKVAVKVRRPRIREMFEADFQVLDMLTLVAEGLTVIRPGFAENLRKEFRATLASELDFRREARFQEVFRRRARKASRDFFSAPKVYAEYSNDEVLVQEFASGMWLSEVLAAVERGDEAAQARMVELNIDPKLLARRLLYTINWGLFEHIAFHADPHPANIVIRANSELVFIDFGACGFLNNPRRQAYAQMYDAYDQGDPYSMAKYSIVSVEPFPPLDLNTIVREVEDVFQDMYMLMKSKHSAWYERTTATSWLGTLQILSKYNVPAPMDVLMYARATLLYDTLAARLDPKITYLDEYTTFGKDMQRKARKRVQKSLRQRRQYGLTGSDFEAIGQIANSAKGLLFRFQRLAAAPYDFALLSYNIEKWVFTLLMLIRFAWRSALLVGLVTVLIALGQSSAGQPVALSAALREAIASPISQIGILVLAIVHIRRLLFRLGERTTK